MRGEALRRGAPAVRRPRGAGVRLRNDDDPARIPSEILDANLDPLARQALFTRRTTAERPGCGGIFAEGDQRPDDRIRGERRPEQPAAGIAAVDHRHRRMRSARRGTDRLRDRARTVAVGARRRRQGRRTP